MVNTDELIAGGGDVEVRLFLIDEEGVRHPDILDKLGPDAQRLDARPFSEGEPRVGPELSEVEVKSEVLSGQKAIEGQVARLAQGTKGVGV